jgi:uncharacterized membrane protein (UPF0127 family)
LATHRILASSLILSVLLLTLAIFSCRSDPRVIIYTKGGRQVPFRVEVADTPSKRELGLQYRRDLADDQGMLFLFPREQIQFFWMKNSPIPLDMIFINRESIIAGIIHQTIPFSTESLSVRAPSQFVLEIKGGLARHNGIEIGDRVRFEGISLEGIKD